MRSLIKDRLSPDQIPNNFITLRMLAFANMLTIFTSEQKGRIALTAGVKIKVAFAPPYKNKPMFRVWGNATDDENYSLAITLHELTKSHFIASCDVDATAYFSASELSDEYITGTVVL